MSSVPVRSVTRFGAKVLVKDLVADYNPIFLALPLSGIVAAPRPDCWREQAWLLKNSFWSVIRVKLGDQKCLEIREDRL
jgi:hypothetical protein